MTGTRLDDPARAFNTRVGERIQRRRRELRIQQEELAEYLGVSHTMIYKYETGRSAVSLPTLVLIAKALQTSPDYFYKQIAVPKVNHPPLVVVEG